MILIADAGNTKTAWAFIKNGAPIMYHKTAGISPLFDNFENISSVVKEASEQLECINPDSIIYFGTGCGRIEMQGKVMESIVSIFPEANITISDDLTGAGLALFGNKEGIAAILGTGSNAGLYSNGKITKRAISLGYLLGDEGSGADIGFRFLKQLLSGNLPQSVANLFYTSFNTTAAKLLHTLYSESKPQKIAASTIPFIAKHQSEEIITNIVKGAIADFIEMFILPISKDKESLELGICGGVTKFFPRIIEEGFASIASKTINIIAEPIIPLAEHYRLKMDKQNSQAAT